MKTKSISITILIFIACSTAGAQDFGLSFSYFIPKNGYFSTPISPFSIRGLGVSLNRFVGIETGASLYRMSGLNLKDLPIESKDPLIGPNFTLLVPLELVVGIKSNRVEFDIKAGGFFFYGLGNKINYGNLDRAILSSLEPEWSVANASVDFKSNPGFGYHGGAELTLYVTSQVGVSLETNYFVGEAKFPISGSYAGNGSQGPLETEDFDFADAKIDFTGLEFSVGLIFSSGGGGKAKPKRRRR